MIVRVVVAAILLAGQAVAEGPWADSVVEYQPGPDALLKNSAQALGEPRGGGPAIPNNSATVSLGGPGGSLTLKFNTPVEDDPLNPLGLDCIVYSNAFWTGGNPQVKFQEPAAKTSCPPATRSLINGAVRNSWPYMKRRTGWSKRPPTR
jgi:hypothetical protein